MICIPVYYIHSQCIVHHDLKPDNILQKHIGDKEIFLITDFGCSKNTKSYSDEENKNTNSEVAKNMISPPYYASSEQLSSNKAHASYDIQSLGIILCKLMAKKEPYIVEIDEICANAQER